jgi:hypothetical protein
MERIVCDIEEKGTMNVKHNISEKPNVIKYWYREATGIIESIFGNEGEE